MFSNITIFILKPDERYEIRPSIFENKELEALQPKQEGMLHEHFGEAFHSD